MKTEIARFLETLNAAPTTVFAYRNSLEQFIKAVGENAELNTETYTKFLVSIKDKSASTQRVYTTAVLKFYAFCNAGNWAELKQVTAVHKRKSGTRVASFHREIVEKVIAYCASLQGDLFDFRDRAFVLTLADTGLRISEACALKCGDLDWQEGRTLIPGKRGKQSIVRFSDRAMQALQDYLHAREQLSAIAHTPFEQQPLFVRHDIRASKMFRPVTAGGMWKAIKDRITEAGVDRGLLRIQDFRHYFVTMVYLARGDLKLSQELARHESISSTSRYTHLGEGADAAYDEIFNKE